MAMKYIVDTYVSSLRTIEYCCNCKIVIYKIFTTISTDHSLLIHYASFRYVYPNYVK